MIPLPADWCDRRPPPRPVTNAERRAWEAAIDAAAARFRALWDEDDRERRVAARRRAR